MRIALCNAIYPTPLQPQVLGGAEVFARQLAEGLVESGCEVIVLRAAVDGNRAVESANGVTVHFLPIRNIFPPFQDKRGPAARLAWHAIDDRGRAPAGTREILADFQPDVLHSHTLNGLSPDIWRVARGLGIPVVHTLHDYYLICPRCSRFRGGHACDHPCGACAALTHTRRRRTRDVDAVTSVSRKTLEIHQDSGLFASDTATHVIHNIARDTLGVVPELPFDGRLQIGYIGRFTEEKGIDLLVEAVAQLPPGRIGLRLAGRATAEDQERLRRLAPDADLTFVGFVDPADFYASVHVTVVPSIWDEPAGLTLIDALASGCPVLGTAMGGIPESIEDGVTGWVAAPRADAPAAVLKRLIAAPAEVKAARDALIRRQPDRRRLRDLIDEYRSVYDSVRGRRSA
ncbi:glycosyltransferase family 4 protein [Sphingomonas sp. KR1UV-12]|uniref:Glycosyltransferase family 4 protein n=1 Tax=Sphingomonas aurea TaxID=3063994 RepID=A0ABT9EIA5_9SPHN|nr:glycosyltransferase family 4 protein [Sphingomonas sp. KR1UV-12]MDP1026699.1 glycosyltransferase family 4 protein [Sphingomonas sp. KR1UV-12]